MRDERVVVKVNTRTEWPSDVETAQRQYGQDRGRTQEVWKTI
jgi:hypothetical protein